MTIINSYKTYNSQINPKIEAHIKGFHFYVLFLSWVLRRLVNLSHLSRMAKDTGF